MSNTLTGLIPTIYAGLNVVSREMVGIVPAVTRDASVARAAVGQAVTVPMAPPATVSDIVPGVTPPNDGDQVFTNVQITLDSAKRVPIRWNGEEARGLSFGPGLNALLVNQWAEGFRAIVNAMEASISLKAFAAASRAAGTPGTTPFSTSGDLTDIADTATILDDNGAPVSDRQLVLGSAAINRLRGRQGLLLRVNEAGTSETLREGVITRLEGFDIHNSAVVKTITKGTGSGYVLGAGSYPVGTTALALATGNGTVNAGDVITLAGDTNAYVVVGTGIAAPGTITIGAPGLRVAHAAGDAVTVGNSYVPNLGFSRSAIVFATRAPALPLDMNGQPRDMATDRTTVEDPVTGIAFEISEYAQYRQIQYEVAAVWGSQVLKAAHVALLRG